MRLWELPGYLRFVAISGLCNVSIDVSVHIGTVSEFVWLSHRTRTHIQTCKRNCQNVKWLTKATLIPVCWMFWSSLVHDFTNWVTFLNVASFSSDDDFFIFYKMNFTERNFVNISLLLENCQFKWVLIIKKLLICFKNIITHSCATAWYRSEFVVVVTKNITKFKWIIVMLVVQSNFGYCIVSWWKFLHYIDTKTKFKYLSSSQSNNIVSCNGML